MLWQGSEYSQCWEEGGLSTLQFYLESRLDGKVVEWRGAGAEMRTRDGANIHQRWRVASTDSRQGQLVNEATGKVLSIAGLSHFQAGLEEDTEGFSTIRAVGGLTFNDGSGSLVALDRGWATQEGASLGLWGERGANKQRFKLLPIE